MFGKTASTRARLRHGLIAAAMAFGLGSAAPEAMAAAPDRIVIALTAEVDNFDLITSTESGLILRVGPNIVETLTYLKASNGSTEPLLAESWEWIEPTRMRVTLRSGVKFSDGSPLTADDVVATLKHGIENKTQMRASYFSTLTGVEKAGDLQVDLITEQPDPVLERRLQFMYVVPAALANSSALTSGVVGTGPYMIDSWTRGQSLVLKRNPNYWREAPPFEGVEFISRPEASVRASALQVGEVHVAILLEPEQTAGLPQVKSIDSNQVTAFVLNSVGQLEGSLMQDVRVRQAVNHAVDRQAIIASIFAGEGSLPKGQFNPQSMAGTNPDLEDYAYDLERAKALLADAGATGKPVRIRTNYGNFLKSREVTEAVSYYLQQAGLVPEVQVVDWSTWTKSQTNHREGNDAPYDLFIASHSNEFFDSSMRTADRLLSRKAGNGTWLMNNDELDEIVKKAIGSSNLDERAQLMRDAWKIVREEALLLPLAVPRFSFGLAGDLIWEPRPDDRIYVREMSWR